MKRGVEPGMPQVASQVGDTLRTMRATLSHALGQLAADERVHAGGRPALVGAALPEQPADPRDYAQFLAREVIRHAVNMASPRELAHMTAPLPEALEPVAEVVLALHQNLVKCEASRSLTPIERQLLGQLHALVFGAGPASREGIHGVCASGGSLANITALWCARNRALSTGGREGLAPALDAPDAPRLVVVGSCAMHYSIAKAADLLGLGGAQAIGVDVDAEQRIDLCALRDALADCRRRRQRPIAIVGVAGATDSGAVDPLDGLAAIARGEGVHFHVDAAWGTPLLFSRRHAQVLRGIELADTVTLDFHKQLGLPVGLAALLFRDPRAAAALAHEAPYMLRADSGDLGRHWLEGSRNGMALVAHAALHLGGRAGLGARVDAHLERAAAFARLVREHGEFELLLEPQTNIVLYRWLPGRLRAAAPAARASAAPALNRLNERLQSLQYERGASHVSRTTLTRLPAYRGVPVVALRAVLVNARTRAGDLRAVLDEQAAIGAELSHERGRSGARDDEEALRHVG